MYGFLDQAICELNGPPLPVPSQPPDYGTPPETIAEALNKSFSVAQVRQRKGRQVPVQVALAR
jgi:hypothetical protein